MNPDALKNENKNILALPICVLFLNGVSINFQLQYANASELIANTDINKCDGSLAFG